MVAESIRGKRIGSGPMILVERGQPAPRFHVSYWCAKGHVTEAIFCVKVTEPDIWDCSRCGLPAGLDPDDPPTPRLIEPYKTHLAYVKERRTDAEGAKLLAEALAQLRQRRGEPDLT